MKLSLLFLACCLMATCFAQNLFYLPFYPSGAGGRAAGHHWPHSYFRGPVGYYNQPESVDYAEEPADEVYARSKYQLSKRLPLRQKVEPAARALTKTVVATTYGATTTITLASVLSCVAKAQFAGADPNLSTKACRRRRDIAQLLDNIEPTSNLDQIETTPVVDATVERIQRDIESSREALLDFIQQQEEVGPRFGFSALNNLLLANIPASTFTTTITIPTSYSFVTTPTTKNVVLGDPGKVSCLPPNMSVC